MQALEFETYVDGEFIKVPNVERLKSKYVKVILLYHEEESESALQLPNIFYTPVTRTHYEPFDREVAEKFNRPLQFGEFVGEKFSTWEDFKMAEWRPI